MNEELQVMFIFVLAAFAAFVILIIPEPPNDDDN